MKDIPKKIDPVEFFAFLSEYRDYPTNGYKLAQAASERGFSEGFAAFLEGIPGELETESDILPFAEEPSKPPRGSALAIEPPPNEIVTEASETETLTIPDVTKGGGPD